jgi:hypothetical protein
MKPAIAVYNLVKNFTTSIGVLYTPMIRFSMSVDEVLKLNTDNPKTTTNEVELLKAALSPEGSAAPVNGMLVGSNAVWADDVLEFGRPFSDTTRTGLLALASRLGTATGPGQAYDNQVSNLFVMDYIIANNDRGGNFHFDPTLKRIWAIDNDDAFVAPSSKKFVANLIANMTHVDRNFLAALDNYFASISDQDLAATVFTEYSAQDALKYAVQTRARYKQIKELYARQ